MVRTLVTLTATGVALALASATAAVAQPEGAEREALLAVEELIGAGLYGEAAERLFEVPGELSPTGLSALGRALALDRRYVTAEEPLRRAVEAGRRDLQTLFFLGSTLWENGKPGEAREVYRAALEISAGHPAILQQLGRLALWSGDYEQAAGYLERALGHSPGHLDLLFDRARALEGAGRETDALAAYREVVARSPDHSPARYGLGRLLVSAGEVEEGRRQLEAYRELHRREQEATRASGRQRAELDRGLALIHAGDPAAAVEHLERLAPTAETLDALATALAAAGRRDEAADVLERAVALAPERRDLRARLAAARLAGASANGE